MVPFATYGMARPPFIVNDNGVPSVAPFIKVTRADRPPAVAVTAPAAGTVSGTIALAADASDASGIASVQFAVDGTAVGPKLTSTPYTTTLDTTTLANGPHAVVATAVSGAGVSATSAAVTVTVSKAASGSP